MSTYKLTIEYEGTRYSGWQTQGNTRKTIQGHLLSAARQVVGEVEVGGAGRTDAGVHAAGQVAHLRSHHQGDPVELMRKLNDLLPHDIHILNVRKVSDAFDARYDAVSRYYLYQISARRSAFAKQFIWWIKDRLDISLMQEAVAQIAGRHDFTAFTDKRLEKEKSRIVVVEGCDLLRCGDLILVRIGASHFLWKMVRKLVAFLVEIGRRNIRPAQLARMFSPDAEAFQPSAPPSGLFLEAIVYPGETFDHPIKPIVSVESSLPRRTRT